MQGICLEDIPLQLVGHCSLQIFFSVPRRNEFWSVTRDCVISSFIWSGDIVKMKNFFPRHLSVSLVLFSLYLFTTSQTGDS